MNGTWPSMVHRSSSIVGSTNGRLGQSRAQQVPQVVVFDDSAPIDSRAGDDFSGGGDLDFASNPRHHDTFLNNLSFHFLNNAPTNMPLILPDIESLGRNASASFHFLNDSRVAGANISFLANDEVASAGVSLVMLILYGAFIPIIAVVGIALNAISLVVLTRPSMRSSVNVYLAGLSLFDFLLLLVALTIFPPFSYCENMPVDNVWCQHVYHTFQISYPIMNIMQTGSIWTVTAMTVDRFLAIIYPLRSRKYLTIRRATAVLLIVLVWSVIYNIPSFFELEKTNGTLELSELRRNQMYITIYKSYCYLFLMFLIPATLMITMNSMVTVAVRRAYKMRKQMSGKDEKERRSTIMAVLVVCTFLVLNLASNVTNILEAFTVTSYTTLVWVGNLLVTVNSTINFFIYCALSLRFRQMFCRIFCRSFCYTPEQEYRYLSRYFRYMQPGGTQANQFTRNTGIISMRSLRKPLIKHPQQVVISADRGAESTRAENDLGSGSRNNLSIGLITPIEVASPIRIVETLGVNAVRI